MNLPIERLPAMPPALSAAARFALRHAALIALAAFALAGAAVLDDYGVSTDEATQRNIGAVSLDYVLGEREALLDDRNRFYGVAFEMPLAAVERLLRLDDTRAVYLSRHLLAHLFFLAGGFFAWLLALRMFGSRAIALFAMLLFLLHPRIYAHSFFNTKDVPFLAMFMVSLYLIHRAFRRDSAAAFVLAGVGVGLLASIRPLGALPFAAVLGLSALDLLRALRGGGGDDGTRRRVPLNGAAFAAAALLTLYATWPLLWNDPLALAESLSAFSRFTYAEAATLFQGTQVRWPNIPPSFIPVWIAVTTPPFALALALAGAALALWTGARRWRDALANTPTRFALLLVGCAVLPIAAVIALNSNVYNDWRQLYFIWAPMCLLAALGLRSLLSALRPFAARAALIALIAVSGALVLARMASLHPHQADYFSPLAGRSESIKASYQMDYWNTSRREALEWLLAEYPGAPIYLNSVDPNYEISQNRLILPKADRDRLRLNEPFPDFIIASESGAGVVWTREIHGGVLTAVLDRREAARAAKIAAYQTAIASEPIAESVFDLHLLDGALAYVKDPCGEAVADAPFSLSASPSDPSDLPESARSRGLEHESLNFAFHRYGAVFDGKCVILRPLPEYPISVLETGQHAPGGGRLWTASAHTDPERAHAFRRALADALASEPAIRSSFDVYLNDGALTYVKAPCGADDTRGRFLLSVVPVDAADLSQDALDAERPHNALNFDFGRYGMILDEETCVILRPLPEYPMSQIETGQWLPGGERLWTATLKMGGGASGE